MRSERLVLHLSLLVISLLLASALSAQAKCPPGTHWSKRYRTCVANKRLPPPPPPPLPFPLIPPPPPPILFLPPHP
jgi:hypothetical protein